jgi:hypothetical protein
MTRNALVATLFVLLLLPPTFSQASRTTTMLVRALHGAGRPSGPSTPQWLVPLAFVVTNAYIVFGWYTRHLPKYLPRATNDGCDTSLDKERDGSRRAD